MQCQSLPDIAQRHLVAGVVAAVLAIGVAQNHVHLVANMIDVDTDDTGLDRRLDAVIDRVLQERLQHQRRHERISGHIVHVPVYLQPGTQAQLLEGEVLATKIDLVRQGRKVAIVGHQYAEQIGHIFQRGFRAPGL